MTDAQTLPQLLLARVEDSPDGDAVRRKRLGIWHVTTWTALAEQVEAVARGLHAAGVRQGDVVAVLSDNRPEWLVVELAAQSLRAAVVGQSPDSSGAEVAVLLAEVAARAVVVEDAQQLREVAAAAQDVPGLSLAVCLDARVGAAAAPAGLDVRLLQDVEAAGRQEAAANPAWWSEQVARGDAGDVAVLCLPTDASATPEELAHPRVAALTHRNLAAASASLTAAAPVSRTSRYVSVLPFGWCWEQVAGVAGSLRTGFPLDFPESPSTQRSDLRDIGPDVLLLPARLWEDLAVELQAALEDAGRARRATWQWALRRGHDRARRGSASPAARVADVLVLRAVRDRLGMTRLRSAFSFGAPLRPDVADLFRSLGIDLRQLYGAVDAGGPVAAQAPRSGAKATGAGSVGSALPGVEVRLAADGAVLVRSDAVPAAPARSSVDADGWLRTGDRGQLDGDDLVVRGRATDLLTVAGQDVSPSLLEAELRASPFVEDAVVVAVDGPAAALGALVVVDAQTTGSWAEQRRLHAPSYGDLAALPQVGELVSAEIGRVLQGRADTVTVTRCVLAPRPLDPARGELTRSRVVRRHVVAEHFAAELAALRSPETAAGVVEVHGLPPRTVQEAPA